MEPIVEVDTPDAFDNITYSNRRPGSAGILGTRSQDTAYFRVGDPRKASLGCKLSGSHHPRHQLFIVDVTTVQITAWKARPTTQDAISLGSDTGGSLGVGWLRFSNAAFRIG